VLAEPSRTAVLAAVARGELRLQFEPPWVLDDPFALMLIGPGWEESHHLLLSLFGIGICQEAWAFHGLRSRYAEDRLTEGAFAQYVILGAGLDSFAWRRPDMLRSLRVFEVDHPATQAWKRERVEALALPADVALVYASVDFEKESLRHGLDAAGFDWTEPAMFSWLGVTHYLTAEAIETTLRTIADAAPGSEVTFDYRADASTLDENGTTFWEIFGRFAGQSGEPLQEDWSPSDIESLILRCGLRVADHPTRAQTIERYFANRADGLVPWSASSLVTARVPPEPHAV
jgi:methyltransferase (TIGR00027 family)